MFSVWFSEWESAVFTELDNLNDNLPASSLPSENRLFENLKGYHLEAEVDNLLGY